MSSALEFCLFWAKATPADETLTIQRIAQNWGNTNWKQVDMEVIAISNNAAIFTTLNEGEPSQPQPVLISDIRLAIIAAVNSLSEITSKSRFFVLRAAFISEGDGTIIIAASQRPMDSPAKLTKPESLLDLVDQMRTTKTATPRDNFLLSTKLIPGIVTNLTKTFPFYAWPNLSKVNALFKQMRDPKKQKELSHVAANTDFDPERPTAIQAAEIFDKVYKQDILDILKK